MSGKVDREHVKDDVQSAIRVEIKVPNEAQGPLPCGACASLDSLERLDRISGCGGVRWTEVTCKLSCELAVPLRLLA